jgi:hypothetical protein
METQLDEVVSLTSNLEFETHVHLNQSEMVNQPCAYKKTWESYDLPVSENKKYVFPSHAYSFVLVANIDKKDVELTIDDHTYFIDAHAMKMIGNIPHGKDKHNTVHIIKGDHKKIRISVFHLV